MTEEKKEEVVEEVIEEVEAPEPVETEKEETTEAPETEKTEVDYEAIEKEETERAPDVDKAKEAFQKRKEKREEEVEEEEEKPLTETRLQEILTANNAKNQKVLSQSSALQLAKDMSSSEAEAKAIVATWNNRIFPDNMSVADQIEETYAIVNRKRIISQKNEAFRALKGKESASKDTASAHKDAKEGSEPKLSPADAQGYRSAGLTWDGKKRLYKKQLGGDKGKKFLYKDPKTGKQWVA